jgi:hypothetical protein
MSTYTPFPTKFPAFALVDALGCIKDGAAATPAGKLQLAHSGWELAGWALHTTLEAGNGHSLFGAAAVDSEGLTDEEAHALLEQATSEPAEGLVGAVACPITPAVALKLAGWLLKAASIVIPILL